MRYLIDGYNLLHVVEVGFKRSGPRALESARQRLLERLSRGPHAKTDDVTIVFDARRAPPGVPRCQDFRGIHILFALRQEADDLIEDMIRQESTPTALTVVSSDRRVQEAARRRACPVLSSLDFLEQLSKPESPLPAGVPEDAIKPESLSDAEAARWMEEFGDLESDPRLKDWFDMNPRVEEE